MKSVYFTLIMVTILYSCSGESKPKADPETIYKQQIQELEYGNICCENMIGYCGVQSYEAAVESFIKPSKYDSMSQSVVSHDSMVVLYKKYFPTIDSALRAGNDPNGFGEYDEKVLNILREKEYNIHKINFDTQRKLAQ